MVFKRECTIGYIWPRILLFMFVMGFTEWSHARDWKDEWWQSWETVKAPIAPEVRRVMAHPDDPKAISALVAGKWKVIATVGLDKGPLVAKDAYKEVLGKEGRIVLSGKVPEIVVFGYENPNCGPATPYAEIQTWCEYCVPPRYYTQISWAAGGYSNIHTWNGKPLTPAQARALTPIYDVGGVNALKDPYRWLQVGYKRQCKGEKSLPALYLQPTRGGMLVQYYVDGYLIYERVGSEEANADCKKAHTASEKAICANPKLQSQDRALAQAYHQAFVRTQAKSPARQKLIQAQRAWIQALNACSGDSRCLQQAYQKRVEALNAQSK